MQNASIEGFSDIVHRSADWRQGARQKTQKLVDFVKFDWTS